LHVPSYRTLGSGVGGFFALAGTASINDVFIVHERDTRVGLWNLSVISSVNIAPIISGFAIVNLGWRWSLWFLFIAFGVLLALTVFCFLEITFDRSIAETPQYPTTILLCIDTTPRGSASEKKVGNFVDPELAAERP
jgi:MFS family permease